jgi:hypothetical protein
VGKQVSLGLGASGPEGLEPKYHSFKQVSVLMNTGMGHGTLTFSPNSIKDLNIHAVDNFLASGK